MGESGVDKEDDRWCVGEARDGSQIRRIRVTKRAIERYDGMEEHRCEPQPNQQRRNQKTRKKKKKKGHEEGMLEK